MLQPPHRGRHRLPDCCRIEGLWLALQESRRPCVASCVRGWASAGCQVRLPGYGSPCCGTPACVVVAARVAAAASAGSRLCSRVATVAGVCLPEPEPRSADGARRRAVGACPPVAACPGLATMLQWLARAVAASRTWQRRWSSLVSWPVPCPRHGRGTLRVPEWRRRFHGRAWPGHPQELEPRLATPDRGAPACAVARPCRPVLAAPWPRWPTSGSGGDVSGSQFEEEPYA